MLQGLVVGIHNDAQNKRRVLKINFFFYKNIPENENKDIELVSIVTTLGKYLVAVQNRCYALQVHMHGRG